MKKCLTFLIPAFIFFCCNSKEEQQKPDYKEGYLEVDRDVRIFYQQIGNGKQITIIPAGWWMYEDFKHLVNDDRIFIFFDMRNRGRSDFVSDTALITIQHDVEDIEKLRRHFKAINMNLIGFSYLGLLVMLYADKYPDHVDKIIQIGAVPVQWDTEYPDSLKNSSRDIAIAKSQVYIDSLIAVKYNEKEPEKFTRLQWDTLIRKQLVGNPANSFKLGRQWGDHVKFSNEWDINFMRHLRYHFGSILKSTFTKAQFADIKNPVLTIHGTKDRNAAFGAGKEWVSILPNARLVRIEGGAHVPWSEYPEQVFDAVDSFLKEK